MPEQIFTIDLEAAYLRSQRLHRLRKKDFERHLELTRIQNSFERISEQLSILHYVLNPVQESEVNGEK